MFSRWGGEIGGWRLVGHMNPKLATRTAQTRVAAIAANQHGAITTAQLLRAGLSPTVIRGWVRAGRLHRIHRGVYAVGHPGLSKEGRWMAAVLACGEGAALSHRSAAALLGFAPKPKGRWDELTPEVTVLGHGGRARRDGIRIYRSSTLLPSHTTRRNSTPVTKPARTLADLRRTISAREWRMALREAEYLRLPLDGLFRSDGTRSKVEAAFLRLLRRHHLPPPEVNVPLGPYTVDFLWRAERLVVEVDTYGTHGGRAMFHTDRERDAWLKRNGWEVLRVTDRWMDEAPSDVASTIRALLRQAGEK
jgi:very-short-patch-repair endonuclease